MRDSGCGMSEEGIGASVRRVEDYALLVGKGRFVADLAIPGALACVIVRSPHPHARLGAIDSSRAAAAPGVAAVF
ncbi:MAG: hypothetical protein WCE38_03125, partial [Burkholderiales bacterium]